MKTSFICLALAAGLTAPLAGLAADDAQLANILEEMRRLRERTETLETTNRQLRERTETLEKRLAALEPAAPKNQPVALPEPTKAVTAATPPAVPVAPMTPEAQRLDLLEKRVGDLTESSKKILPGVFNPAIGLVGDQNLSYTSKRNDQTGDERTGGFNAALRSMELGISASVDPFARAYVVLNAAADTQTGESTAAVEEASVITTSLPGNLTLQGGRFFAEFGRLAYVHDHELPFVNRPQVLDRYLGGESKTDGLQINWLVPTDHYVSLTAGIGDQFGEPKANAGPYRGADGLSYWARASTYFALTQNLSLETGISGMMTPEEVDRDGILVQADGSTLTETGRRVAGLDLTLRYEPLQDNEFRGFVWGTEALASSAKYRFDPDGSLNPDSYSGFTGDEHQRNETAFGFYSYVAAKLSRRWTVGFLYEQMQNPENHGDDTQAYSPYLTLEISHFHKLRLQYTHTDRDELRSNDAIFLQWTWILGAHAHGFSSR
jgi:hypothetical protein